MWNEAVVLRLQCMLILWWTQFTDARSGARGQYDWLKLMKLTFHAMSNFYVNKAPDIKAGGDLCWTILSCHCCDARLGPPGYLQHSYLMVTEVHFFLSFFRFKNTIKNHYSQGKKIKK